MFWTAIIKAGLSSVLEWLTSLWDRFIQKQENIEKGRQEVREVVREKTEKIKDEWREIRDNPVAVDDAFDELRRLAEGDNSNGVPKVGPAASVGSGSPAKGQPEKPADGAVGSKT